MEWSERISFDPAICNGRVCIRGTRIPVSVVLDNLADGLTVEQIIASYPTLSPEDISAAVAYAADVVSERIVPISTAN